MSKNKARDVPQVNYGASDGVDVGEGNGDPKYPIVYSFPDSHPIFWGPGQDTEYRDGTKEDYVEPPKARFAETLSPLDIPVVIRGITGHNTSFTPPPPTVPPTTGHGQCKVGNSGTIVIGYQHGMDGMYGVGRSSPNGRIIPGYYDEEHGYPNGIPCGGGIGTQFTYYKAFVMQNDISKNYGPFQNSQGGNLTTLDIVRMMQRPEEHNKGAWQNYVSTAYAELSVPGEMVVNIGGGPAPGVYQTGCFGRGLGTMPFAATSGQIIPLPTAGYPAGEGPTPGDGNQIVSYFLTSGGDPKFTIFFFTSCQDLFQGRFFPYYAMFPGWITELPPPPFGRFNRPGQVPGPNLYIGPLEPGGV